MDSHRQDDNYRPSHNTSHSRSPARSNRKNDRSRSPKRRRHHHHHHQRSSHHDARPAAPAALPYNSPALQRHDLKAYEALFAEYLDVQKSLAIRDLDREEVKGRWKSFLGKWNRGILAEGWYDPAYRRRCEERYAEDAGVEERASPQREVEGYAQEVVRRGEGNAKGDERGEEDEDDGYGPALPGAGVGRSQGPVMPKLQDLQERRERLDEDHEAQRADLRYERKQERQTQKDRLDEMVPRAEAGTRERQIEKKREVAASNRAFKDAKETGDVEVADGELMGDGGVDGYKAEKKKREKVKNEREIRKEEVLRARAEEREGRMAEMRGKEEKTMEMLRGLAKARFG